MVQWKYFAQFPFISNFLDFKVLRYFIKGEKGVCNGRESRVIGSTIVVQHHNNDRENAGRGIARLVRTMMGSWEVPQPPPLYSWVAIVLNTIPYHPLTGRWFGWHGAAAAVDSVSPAVHFTLYLGSRV